jgi:phage gp46-like protein
MSDLKMIETGSGGDLVLNGNDFESVSGFQNMIYLALFGGNIEENTKTFEIGEERSDYWGNELLYLQEPKVQFNSDTERLLKNVALNSSSVLIVEETIKSDLAFMNDFATISVDTLIRSIDRIEIKIKIDQPDSLESPIFTYIWDITKQELTSNSN